jgi:hypothetical protein
MIAKVTGALPGSRRSFLRGVAAFAAIGAAEAALAEAVAAAPSPILVWWRHDDVGVDSPAFARIVAMAERRQAPVAFATVPKILKPECVNRILGSKQATVVQHGYVHKNNAATGKQVELGGAIDRNLLASQLRSGRERLAAAFGPRFLPMQVAPWNSIAPDVLPMLRDLGFTAVSTSGRRKVAEAAPGLRQINIHFDVYKWAAPRGSRTYEENVKLLTTQVRASKGEPIGILSHHSVMKSEQDFVTLDRLLAFVQQQLNMRLVSVKTLMQGA